LTGAFSGAGAAELDSALEDPAGTFGAENFGAGASGFEESKSAAGAWSAELYKERDCSRAAAGAEEEGPAWGVVRDKPAQQNRMIVERTKNHLSIPGFEAGLL
jgi:hypothetical protein